MFAFISTAYLILFPILLFVIPFSSKQYDRYLLSLRATLQFSLIVYSIYLVRQLIGLYQFRKMFHMPESSLDYLGSGLIEMCCIIALPFLFLFKRVLHSWVNGLLVWLILFHASWKQDWVLPYDGWQLVNAVLFYISLLTSIYALLWLLKKIISSSSQ